MADTLTLSDLQACFEQVRSTGFVPNTVIMHPDTWAALSQYCKDEARVEETLTCPLPGTNEYQKLLFQFFFHAKV